MKKNKKKILIIAASILLVIGICATVFVMVLCSGVSKSEKVDYEMAKQGLSDYFDTKSHVAEITSEFKDSNGYIKKENIEKTISTVGDYAKSLYEEKKIKDYEITENKSVWFQFNSGVEYIFIPVIEGMDSSTITTYQPCLAVYNADLQSLGTNCVDGSAKKIATEINDYVFENNYDNDSISLDVLKQIGNNQIVIWHGHGGYSKKTHSILQTGLKLDEEKFLLDPIYYIKQIGYTNDYLTGRIICSDSGYVVVTYKFFEKYLSSLNTSIIYLGACDSGKDDVLANTFIKKGAKAVVGNTEEIPTIYNLHMISSVFNELLLSNENKYLSIQVALDNAKKDNAELYRETGCIADVKIWGENSIRLSEKDISSNTKKVSEKPTETEPSTEKQTVAKNSTETSTEIQTEVSTEIQTVPVSEKTDLYNYLGTDLYQFVDMIGDMHDVGATDGTKEYSNGTIIASARPDSGDKINFFSLRANSDYCIKGIETGMTMEDAAALLSDYVITDNLDYYKRFVIDSQYYISFHGENGVVDSISVGSTY